MLRIEGTEYQIVIRLLSMKSRTCTGKTDAPRRHQHDGGAGHRGGVEIEDRQIEMQRRVVRQPVVRATPNVSTAHPTNASAFRCENITPFGLPGRSRGVEDVREIETRSCPTSGAVES